TNGSTATTPSPGSAAIQEFMELSGLHQQLEWMAVTMRSQLQARLGAFEAEDRASIDRVAAVTFGANRLQTLVRETLSGRVAAAMLANAASWFRAAAGRRITGAEVAASMPQASDDIARFARQRAGTPIDSQRSERLRRLDEASGSSEFAFDVIVAVAEG